jgi:uncharacterized repeat protein (TIGR01451 family)
MTGHARAMDSCDVQVADTDVAVYDCGCVEEAPSVSIEKATEGHDADTWDAAPTLAAGTAVTWTYVVTNDGGTPLHDVRVEDDDASLTVSCPEDALDVGESMTCTAQGMAGDQPYQNLGIVTALSHCDAAAIATDPSHYVPEGPQCDEGVVAGLALETLANGEEEPEMDAGDPVLWTFELTNTGNRTLFGVAVSDTLGLAVICPGDELAAGASMTCTAMSTAQEGGGSDTATASGHTGGAPECQQPAQASDGASYTTSMEPPGGDQGCTPGYWKNHTDSWPATGYAPSQSVGSVFSAASGYPDAASASLLQALDFGGGSGVDGAVRNLLRAAVASLLNSAHGGVGYPRGTASVIADVDTALASGDRDTMLSLAAALDGDNNLGCPLN